MLVGAHAGQYGKKTSFDLYNFKTGEVTHVKNFRNIAYAKGVLMKNGVVLVVGGICPDNFEDARIFPKKGILFNPATNVFKFTMGRMMKGRQGHAICVLSDGKVFITGGQRRGRTLKSTEMYDPSSDSFERGPEMFVDVRDHTATLLQNGDVLICGGRMTLNYIGYITTNFAQIYNHKTGKMTISSKEMNVGRYYHQASLLSDGKVLISGGSR